MYFINFDTVFGTKFSSHYVALNDTLHMLLVGVCKKEAV